MVPWRASVEPAQAQPWKEHEREPLPWIWRLTFHHSRNRASHSPGFVDGTQLECLAWHVRLCDCVFKYEAPAIAMICSLASRSLWHPDV